MGLANCRKGNLVLGKAIVHGLIQLKPMGVCMKEWNLSYFPPLGNNEVKTEIKLESNDLVESL